MTTSIERLYGPGEDKFGFFTYSRSEAARMLGVDIQTIDGLIASRQLRASRIGKPGSKRPRVAVRAASLEARLALAAPERATTQRRSHDERY
jgi:hypothetical protein